MSLFYLKPRILDFVLNTYFLFKKRNGGLENNICY
jgi:hypothetical protein